MDRKKLYMHLGTGKTGTTAIQELLDANADFLAEEHGILYASSGKRGINHHLLCANFQRTDPNVEQRVRHHLQELAQEIEQTDLHTVVVSSEYFPDVTAEEIESIYLPILSEVAEIHPVLYLRRQDTFLESWYGQIAKAQTAGWAAGIHRLDERLRAAGIFDYLDHADRWARHTGDENTHVRPFERRQLVGEDAGYDFLDVLGIEDRTGIVPIPHRSNPSLTRDQLILLQVLQAAKIDAAVLKQLSDPFPELSDTGSRFLLSPEERQQVIDDHDDVNSEVARRFLGREDGRLFLDPGPVEAEKGWEPQDGPSSEVVVAAIRKIAAAPRSGGAAASGPDAKTVAEIDSIRRSLAQLSTRLDKLSPSRKG